MKNLRIVSVLAALLMVLSATSGAAPVDRGREQAATEYWTAARIASAIPRDLVIDHRGLGYLRLPSGGLEPYGHAVAAEARGLAVTQVPLARNPVKGRPGGGGSDTRAPEIGSVDPDGIDIPQQYTFTAVVSDLGGVKAVTFTILGSLFNAQLVDGSPTSGVWAVSVQFDGTGTGTWAISAKDTAKGGGNTAASGPYSFTVTGTAPPPPPPPPPGDIVTNAMWQGGGTVQDAAGRLLYEMPANKRHTRWTAYVCSGTVVTDGVDGRSVVLTAAHCVYDDANKAFARNVIFIPNQAALGIPTDWNCSNDFYGCWTAAAGVVDVDWTTRKFPANVHWDYAYYVFPDGSHSGSGGPTTASLEGLAGSLSQSFDGVSILGTTTHALGYSYSDDPNFMYCAEPMENMNTDNYWLPNCDLSGGSSGGPWLQPVTGGNGPIISVNSWGYTTSPGMAGPKLIGTSAKCVFGLAEGTAGNAIFGGSCP